MTEIPVSLRDYFEARFVSLGARLDAYVEQHREMHEQLSEQVKHAAAAIERRLEGMNELRGQLNSERGHFVSRDMLDQRNALQETRLAEIDRRFEQRLEEQGKRVSDIERARANLDGRIATWGTMFLGASVVINLIIAVASHFIGH